MAEYIERESVISWLKKAGSFLKAEVDHKRVCHVIGKIIDHIEAIPAADVVEVVRCKDCDNSIRCEQFLYCTHFGRNVDKDDFCSYGC